ncbi:lysine--tRNA ligase [Treponema parvum]|uniref:lysine--tRNA ligase n=1 Tax=Treponema parvum TaxID=138851 RepID=UPI001AEC16C4|nr:lysine--tRNA ligase [Treponema parvum]QTQ15791.1 lysine--tRNA ligase [Treponema parvum]
MSNENKNPLLCHWADQMADKIIRERGDLPSYTCASGITPSGTVHIGNFREIITVDLVVRALRDRGKNVRFIYSWDDYDVFRKIPANMPDPEILEKYLRFPITMVPDTTGRNENYARHHEVDIERELPRVGIMPEFLYQAERYRANRYSEGMKKALQNRLVIKDCLNEYRDEDHKMQEEYWPVSAFCSKCNRDTTSITGYDNEYALSYKCECGHSETADLRSFKGFKLGWRVDWPMRWSEEKVVFEPGGKDHISPGGSYDTAKLISKKIYDWDAPVTMRYDFVTLKGIPGKMSSSKGHVIALADALKVYQPEVLRYIFAGTRPNTEFSISFDLDVIKVYEDYDKTERIVWGLEKAKNDDVLNKEKRIYMLSQIENKIPEVMPFQVGFRLLTTLLQTYSGDIDAVIASLNGVKPEQKDALRRRAECAWYWVTECAPEEFKFALCTDKSKAELSDGELSCVKKLYNDVLPSMNDLNESDLNQKIFDIATELNMQPKDMFRAVYQVLIRKDQGPRLASFMKIIGKDKLASILEVYL